MSKLSMSIGVKKFQDLNVVKKIFYWGICKYIFVVEKDFFKFFINFFFFKWEWEVQVNVVVIEEVQVDL